MTKAAELAKMGEVLSNSQLGRKNIIINGGMQLSQRSTSVTGIGASSGYFTLDRFYVSLGAGDGRFTMSQSSVTDLEGFSNALKVDCTTADTSIAAGEALVIAQHIEGFNLQQLKATSTTTKAFTLSFYAKSNASRAIVSEIIFSNGTNRQMSKLHTIGTSWARYTMTVPAASSTQIDNDNSNELQLNFWLHGGSTYTGGTLNDDALDSVTNANRAAGIGSIFASTDNEIEITGVQMEVGSQATPFEHRSFGEELVSCQRYFYKAVSGNNKQFAVGTYYATSLITSTLTFPTTMRAAPTITVGTGTNYYVAYGNGQGDGFDTWDNTPRGNENYIALDVTGDGASGTAGDGCTLATNNANAYIHCDAEL